MSRAVRTGMDFIRKHYNVPAKRGMRVKTKQGRGYITGSTPGGRVRVRLFRNARSEIFHLLEIEYPRAEVAS